MTEGWVASSVEKYQKIKRRLPVLKEVAFDQFGSRGWCLTFKDEVVARWTTGGLANSVLVRVR